MKLYNNTLYAPWWIDTFRKVILIVTLLIVSTGVWAATEYVSNGKVRYNVGSYGFNIQFCYNGDWKRTTFGDGGYYTYISVNNANKQVVNGSSQLVLGHPYTIDGIEVTITLSFPDPDGAAVSIQYTVTNTTSSPVSIKLGSCADTQVGTNDGATVSIEDNQNGQKYIVMRDGSTGAEYKISAGVGDLAFTRMWYGSYSNNENGSSYKEHVFDSSDHAHSSTDTALAWSWDITIPAGATVRRYAGGGEDVLSLQSAFVVMDDYTYGGTPSTPSVSDIASVITNNETPTIIYYYNTTNSNIGGTAWSSSMTGTSLQAGTYYMYAVLNSTPHYNKFTTAPEAFKVIKKAVKVSGITASNKVYDGNASAAVSTTNAVFEGIENGDALTVSATGTFTDANVGTEKTVNIGTLTLGGSSVGNYKLADTGNQTTTTANITAKALTITANAQTITYGNAISSATTDVTATGLADGDALNSITLTKNATEYSETAYENDITPSSAVVKRGENDVTSNYTISYVEGYLTIEQRALTITADAKSKIYGEADPSLTYTSSELVTGDAITGSLSRDAGENVGTYAINQGTLTAGDNYNISYTSAYLTVSQASITPSVSMDGWTYGSTATEPNVTGNTDGGAISYTYKAEGADEYGSEMPINAGTHTVKATIAATTNYSGAEVTQEFTINKAMLTVTAQNVEREIGSDNPVFTIGYSGFVNNETSGVLTTQATATCTADAGSAVGSYTISVSGAAATNYDFNYVPGTLKIYRNFAFVDSDWKTWYGAEDLSVDTSDMETYVVTEVTGTAITVESTEGNIYIGKPMLVKRKSGKTNVHGYAPASAIGSPTGLSAAFIGGVSSFANYTTGTVYVLAGEEFLRTRVSADTGFDPSKCFIYLTTSNANSRLSIGGDGTTGIDSIDNSQLRNDNWYTLGGRKLNKRPTQPGIYIRNNKKVIVK